ncbi:MAG: class II aldolase/adducin family protein [Rubrobacteraceae bacterium]
MREEIIAAAQVLAAEGLVTAFGHASARRGQDGFLITPPKPLGSLQPNEPLLEVPLDESELPAGVPGEAWIHWALYKTHPGVEAICRAQPTISTALASAGVPIRPLHGQGAFLGKEVPIFDDARLIRNRESGEVLARRLGRAKAVVLRGNGALTVGKSIGAAVARMWVLEVSAELNRIAAAVGNPQVLSPEEFSYWESVGDELLERIWSYLKTDRRG